MIDPNEPRPLTHRLLITPGWSPETLNLVEKLRGMVLGNDALINTADDLIEELLQMFTQQHYEKLAETISNHLVEIEKSRFSSEQMDAGQHDAANSALTAFAYDLIKIFEKENPKFKPFKFIEAAFGKANDLRKPKEK